MYNKLIRAYETHMTLSPSGYRHTHVLIREMYEEDVAVHLEGTVDNKAGYGTRQAAEKMGRTFQAMLDAGHTVFFDTTLSGLDVSLQWQHYHGNEPTAEQDYCDPEYVSFGRSLGQIETGLKTLKQMGRKIEKNASQASGV